MDRNAVILAAGTASRFVPLSLEIPKGLLEVRGEVLVERQIRQLRQAGVKDITLVVGYMADSFAYLREKYGVDMVYNEDFAKYNNISSLIRVVDRLGDTYICSSDNYFTNNVFKGNPTTSYYSARYAYGMTDEYCLTVGADDEISDVEVGGHDSWYMVGHVYFSRDFSEKFRDLLVREYADERTRLGYWEDLYIRHIADLPPMRINRYGDGEIEEFDSIDELRLFDPSYVDDTRSTLLRQIAGRLDCSQSSLTHFTKAAQGGDHPKFTFMKDGIPYMYDGRGDTLLKL